MALYNLPLQTTCSKELPMEEEVQANRERESGEEHVHVLSFVAAGDKGMLKDSG